MRTHQRVPIDALCLVVLEAVFLVAFQYTSAPVLVHTMLRRYMPVHLYLEYLSQLQWRTVDLLLFAGILITFIAIVLLDVFKGSVSRLLRLLFSNRWLAVLTTFICCMVAVRFYFSIGRMTWAADASHHALHTWIAAEGIRSGTIPVWTPLLSVGTWFVQFYGFAFAYLSGMVVALVDDLETGLKIVLGLIHAASGVTMYLYVRALTGSRSAGFVSGIAFVLIFWHTQLVVTMGRYTAALVFALLPLPFFALERLWKRPSHRAEYAVICAISVALLAYTHPGYAFWAVGFLILHVIVIVASSHTRRRLPLREVGLALGLGIALSLYLILPMWMDQYWTGLGVGFSMASQPKPSWSQLLVWSNYRARIGGIPPGHNHWFGGYIGFSLLLITAAGYSIRARRFRLVSHRDFPILGLGLSLILTFCYNWPILRDLPVVHAMGSSRYLVFAVFFLSALTGISAQVLRARVCKFRPSLTFILAVILIDLGSTSFTQPYHFMGDPGALFMQQKLFDALTEVENDQETLTFKPTRTLHASKPINSYLSVISRTPTTFGLFEEHPRADREFIRPFLRRLREKMDVERQTLSAYLGSPDGGIAANGLRLLNTQHYILDRANVPIAHLNLKEATPITIAQQLEPFEATEGEENAKPFEMIAAMGFDPTTQKSRAILSRSSEPEVHPVESEFELESHNVYVDRAVISFRTTEKSFARLSYGYYPNLEIRLNGAAIDYFCTADGFIGLRVPAGRHQIEITGHLTPLRFGLLILNALLLVAAISWVYRERNQTARRKNG